MTVSGAFRTLAKASKSTGVGCSVKHFVANDSEFERMTISSEVDARTLREISLVPFEAAVLGLDGVAGHTELTSRASALARVSPDAPPFLIAHGDGDKDWAVMALEQARASGLA